MPVPKRTPPSSRIKLIPKEGSKKFVGPRSQSGLLAEEVLATNPPLYREWTPKPSPKNRQASTKGKPETRRPPIPSALRVGSNPDDVPPSAVDRAYKAGRGNRLQFDEMLKAVKKLPPDLREKLGKALRAGVRGKKNIRIYHF